MLYVNDILHTYSDTDKLETPDADQHLARVLAQRQLLGMRREIDLAHEICDAERARIVRDEGDRRHQWHQSATVVFNAIEQLAARGIVEAVAQVPDHVMQDIGVPRGCGELSESPHELALI